MRADDVDDVALVRATRAGDRSAFADLVERYQKPVYSLAYRMLGRPGDAEDAAQEVFLKAYRALDRYDERRSFSTWLLAIAAHHCIDQLRRKRVDEVSLDGMPSWRWVPVETVDPERAAEASDRAERVTALLDDLPEDYRLVIVLRYWHDMGYAEIADVTGDTISAVKSRLHRARRQLAAALAGSDDRQPNAPAGPERSDETAAAGPRGGLRTCSAMMPAG